MSDRCTVLHTIKWSDTWVTGVQYLQWVTGVQYSSQWVTGVQYSLQWVTGVQYSYNQMNRHMNDRCTVLLTIKWSDIWVTGVQYPLQWVTGYSTPYKEWQVYSTPYNGRCTVLLTMSDRCTVLLTIKWSDTASPWEWLVYSTPYNQLISDRSTVPFTIQYPLQSTDQWQEYSTLYNQMTMTGVRYPLLSNDQTHQAQMLETTKTHKRQYYCVRLSRNRKDKTGAAYVSLESCITQRLVCYKQQGGRGTITVKILYTISLS